MIAPQRSQRFAVRRAPAKRGLNLVALARPYFGLIVLATLLLAVVRRSWPCCGCPAASIPKWPFRESPIVAQTPGWR